eukprot:3700959-Amphidinium_carterae.1
MQRHRTTNGPSQYADKVPFETSNAIGEIAFAGPIITSQCELTLFQCLCTIIQLLLGCGVSKQ